jgi:hypothetical protein
MNSICVGEKVMKVVKFLKQALRTLWNRDIVGNTGEKT